MNPNPDRRVENPLYVGTRGLTRVVAAAFVLTAATGWAAAGFDLGELNALLQGERSAAQHLAHQKAGAAFGLAQIACASILAAVFLPWLYQVRGNLRAFGVRGLRFPSKWTCLAFLRPGVDLSRPLEVVSEVWRASVARSPDPSGWQQLGTPPVVAGWWLGLLGWIGAELASFLLLALGTGLGAIQIGRGLALAGDVSAAVGASLGFLLVTQVQRAQAAKSAAYRAGDLSDALLDGSVPA